MSLDSQNIAETALTRKKGDVLKLSFVVFALFEQLIVVGHADGSDFDVFIISHSLFERLQVRDVGHQHLVLFILAYDLIGLFGLTTVPTTKHLA